MKRHLASRGQQSDVTADALLMEPCAALAAAVISRALKDARHGDTEACAWLQDGEGPLAFWCELLGCEPEHVSWMVRGVMRE